MELDEEQEYFAAIGLLSVHGSIALADAVLSSVDERRKAEDHVEAARALRKWCTSTNVESAGVKHFEWLLKKKNRFSYDADPVPDTELQTAKVKMDQFFAWAFRAFPDVAQVQKDEP